MPCTSLAWAHEGRVMAAASGAKDTRGYGLALVSLSLSLCLCVCVLGDDLVFGVASHTVFLNLHGEYSVMWKKTKHLSTAHQLDGNPTFWQSENSWMLISIDLCPDLVLGPIYLLCWHIFRVNLHVPLQELTWTEHRVKGYTKAHCIKCPYPK